MLDVAAEAALALDAGADLTTFVRELFEEAILVPRPVSRGAAPVRSSSSPPGDREIVSARARGSTAGVSSGARGTAGRSHSSRS
jgi:hypothetical protein